ncbi:hypothetical protein [Roseimarinus sediminis]|uniref:hypothetical protein n=1 Tax=Roseimarinus sediminis TaxID=1610899 RepID=UPI003D254723
MKAIFTIILLVTWVTLSAQSGYQNVVEKRIEFLSSKLTLTPNEAQQFWPVFREFHKEREQATNKRKNIDVSTQGLSQDECRSIVDDYIDAKVQQTALLEKYHKKYLAILPPQKVLELYKFDEEFNKDLLKQIKEAGHNKK